MNSTENTTFRFTDYPMFASNINNKIKNLEKSIIALDAIGKKYEEVLGNSVP